MLKRCNYDERSRNIMKKFGFGLMRLPLLDQADTKSVDIETVKKMVDAFLATGFRISTQQPATMTGRVRSLFVKQS